MSKVHIITYGCTANQADSQIMESVLKKEGHKITDFDSSDYIIVNTCAVKEATENKIIHMLSKLSKTDKKVIVGGCLTKINLERIKKAAPKIAGILDTRSIDRVSEIIKNSEEGKRNHIFFSDKSPIKPNLIKSSKDITGIIQLSEGCDLSCTYCATTIARGDLDCFSPEDIVRGASYLVKNGSKEILLTSQDNGAYKFGDVKLPDLLEKICQIDSDFFVRNGMTNPLYLHSILKPLIEVYKNPKMYKFLHIPVQSGSNSILESMKRGYKIENFINFIEDFRKEIPEITISTDIIVGFPGETEEDFEQTKNLLEEIKFDVVNLSKFGARPGTEAAKMKQVDKKIVNKRSAELAKIIRKNSLEKNKNWIGWEVKSFVNEKPDLLQIGKEQNFKARNIFYKPISIKSEKNVFGQIIDVKITGYTQANLIGEIID